MKCLSLWIGFEKYEIQFKVRLRKFLYKSIKFLTLKILFLEIYLFKN